MSDVSIDCNYLSDFANLASTRRPFVLKNNDTLREPQTPIPVDSSDLEWTIAQ